MSIYLVLYEYVEAHGEGDDEEEEDDEELEECFHDFHDHHDVYTQPW